MLLLVAATFLLLLIRQSMLASLEPNLSPLFRTSIVLNRAYLIPQGLPSVSLDCARMKLLVMNQPLIMEHYRFCLQERI